MIRKTAHGYQVKSEHGKNMSADNLTKAQAHKRLGQVEYFKHNPHAKYRGLHPSEELHSKKMSYDCGLDPNYHIKGD